MSLAGGPADKLGNRYELWWTVLKVMDMLRGEWDAIRLEQPGVEKAEFVLRGPSIKSFHQAKRQSGEGKWTLAELSSKDNPYLQAITHQLQDANTRIVFRLGKRRASTGRTLFQSTRFHIARRIQRVLRPKQEASSRIFAVAKDMERL